MYSGVMFDPRTHQPWWLPWLEWLTAQRGYAELSRRDRVLYHLALVGIGLGFLWAFLPHPTYVGSFGDIRYFHYVWEVSRKTVMDYGQYPWWTPWHCGGTVHGANAQSMFLSPFFPLSLAFGAGVGMRAFLVAHFFVGLYGGIVLAREFGVRGPGTWLAGFAFAFGGFFPERATGHVSFLTLTYLPWVIFAYLRARGGAGLTGLPPRRLDLRWALVAGLFVVAATFQGGVYPTPILILTLAVYALVDVLAALVTGGRDPTVPRWWAPLAVGAVAGAVYLTVGAIKWWPVLDFLSEYPRLEPMKDALGPLQMIAVFLRRTIERHNRDYVYVFGEYRNYLGPVVVVLALASWRWIKRWWRPWLVALVFVGLMAGNHGPLAPYALLNKLPIFGSLRVPARYAIVVDIHLAVMAGWVLMQLLRARRRRKMLVLAGLLLFVGGSVDLLEVNNNMLPGLFNTPPPVDQQRPLFVQAPGNGNEMFRGPPANRGTVRCYEPNHVAISSSFSYRGTEQARLVSPGAGTVATMWWSPNRVRVAYDVKQPATMILNQNFHRHWHAVLDGRYFTEIPVASHHGLIAVGLAPGAGSVTLIYRPWYAGLALALTLLGVLGVLAGLVVLRPSNHLWGDVGRYGGGASS